MYERHYGSKYESLGGYASAADIAKRMRADIKALVKAGHLPDVTYSVRVDNYSMGRSINISIQGLKKAWETVEVYQWGYPQVREVLSVQGKWVERQVKKIHSSYNYDGSEVQVDYFDVNFYGQVKVESDWDQQFRERQAARMAEKKARQAANPPKPVVLKPGQDWPECSKEVHPYLRCRKPATVLQPGKQRHFRQDHWRCDVHKRGLCREIIREEVKV